MWPIAQCFGGTVAAVTGVISYLVANRTFFPAKADAHPSCITCGYNLTGNVSGICPECGQKIAQ